MSKWNELTNHELAALPTHRLYQVYKKYQHADAYDASHPEERDEDDDRIDIGSRRDFIKMILDNRGHVERDIEVVTDPKMSRHTREFWANREAKHVPQGPIKDAWEAVGKQVFKRSGKPFKSKDKYNTVKAVTQNPHTGLEAFSFNEDTSIVDVHVCNTRK